MHPIRFILAVIFGGYAALLLAHPIAEQARVTDPAGAGLFAVVVAPVVAGLLVGLVLVLRGGRKPASTRDALPRVD